MPRIGGRADVEIRGLRDFRAELRSLDRGLGRDLRVGLKSAAELVAAEARRRATAEGGVLAKSAESIKAQAVQSAAKISWGSARQPFALGAVMGAKQYPQFGPWVGNTWQIGQAGEGPRAVNDAIASREDELIEAVGDVVERLAARAFPT